MQCTYKSFVVTPRRIPCCRQEAHQAPVQRLALSTCQEPLQLMGQGVLLSQACRAHVSVSAGARRVGYSCSCFFCCCSTEEIVLLLLVRHMLNA
jgi:hypothetical protein